jgi:hypothetical protein
MLWRCSLPFILPAMIAFPSGCRDECRPGEAKCEDNVALNCYQGEDSPPRLVREDCGAMHCVSGPSATAPSLTSAFCALDPTPDPKCQPTTVVGYCKTSASAETCHDGYRVKEIPCEGPARCVGTGECGSARPGVACFDASLYVGGDAANWVCTNSQVRGTVDPSCPTTALPAVPEPPSAGCCLGTGRCGIFLTDLAADGLPIGCIDPAIVGLTPSTQRCGASVDAGPKTAH